MIMMSNLPLYEQIKKDLMEKIENKQYLPGQRIKSERALAEEYKVSRVTVRQAIGELIDKGLLVKKSGSGTYVKNKVIEQPMARLCGIVEELQQQNISVSIEVLEKEYYRYSEKNAYLWGELSIQPQEQIYRVKRRLYAAGQPLLLDYNYTPAQIGRKFETLDCNQDVFFLALEYFGYEIGYAKQNISAGIASSSQAGLLGLRPGAPVLNVERITYSSRDIPLLYTQALFAGNKYQYSVMLKRNI